MAKTPVQFRLNGADKAVFVDGGENLLNALRRGVGDMSAKFGCGQGTCGVCTVLIDGEPQLACLTLAETCAGRSIETALGLADGPSLHPLQTAFMEHFAAQCGFCTLGHADGRQGAARPQSRRRRARTWPRPSPATSAAAPATSRSSTPSWMPPPSAADSASGEQGHARV